MRSEARILGGGSEDRTGRLVAHRVAKELETGAVCPEDSADRSADTGSGRIQRTGAPGIGRAAGGYLVAESEAMRIFIFKGGRVAYRR